MVDRVGQVWRVEDEDGREAGIVLVVGSLDAPNDPIHFVEVLWEPLDGYVLWCLGSDRDGRLWLFEPQCDGSGISGVERVL